MLFLGAVLLIFASCQKTDLVSADMEDPAAVSALKSDGAVLSPPAPCIQRCLVAGKNMNVGTVDVAVGDEGDLLITYNITAPGIYLMETHTDVFSSIDQFKGDKKLSNGGAIPGKFTFKRSWKGKDKATTYTVVVPKAYIDQHSSNGCLFIATHASLSNGETAWGGLCADTPTGVSLENARQFPGKNWSVYFDFCMDECQTVDFTYAWEDLRNESNDADYNDLIVQTDAVRTGDQLKLKFFVTARGAAYDHQFKIKIPKQGITAIGGANGDTAPFYASDGSNYIITVIASTKEALPPYNSVPHVNTWRTFDCVPYGQKEIVLTVDDSFTYNTAKPYEPFITVYTSGKAGVGNSYDLSIFELTGQDTWITPSGDVYPNGILMPKDWDWPNETQAITGPYPDFPQANWAANFADPSLTWDKTKCD